MIEAEHMMLDTSDDVHLQARVIDPDRDVLLPCGVTRAVKPISECAVDIFKSIVIADGRMKRDEKIYVCCVSYTSAFRKRA